MTRPELGTRDRVRVEFRLPQAAADAVYRCAREWNVSLSEAGTRLIDLGYKWAAGRPAVSELTVAPIDHEEQGAQMAPEAGGAASQG